MLISTLAVYLLLTVQFSHSRTLQQEPFKSSKAPAETIANYNVVRPVISNITETKDGKHPLYFTLDVSGVTVHLELNRDLFPAHFTSKHFDEQGEEVVSRGHVNCFYQGWVEGHPEWKATMSTCHGLRGSFGDSKSGDHFYHIEPLDSSNTEMDQPHVVYLDSEYSVKESNCGTPHSLEAFDSKPDHHPVGGHAKNRLKRQNDRVRIVEWAVINDQAQFTRYGTVDATVERALEIANYLDMLYRDEYNIRIVLTYVETWSTGNRIAVPSEASALLNNFERYSISAHRDSVMLITGIDLDGSTVGIANVRAMCSSTRSVGLTQDRGRGVENTGATAAHELGHIFNMDHDDAPRETGTCSCNDPSGNCIMASVSGFPSPTLWSSCSRDDLLEGFNEHGLDFCLFNEPAVFVGDPVCGNGLREEGEICDCGTPESCVDPCCNATSCQLVNGAECFTGGCCNECKFRLYGTTCRAWTQECDILDYCSGDSSDCPDDARVQNGQICNNNMSYCFSGVCTNIDSQCQTYFGTNMGIERCYTNYNTRGDRFGNCGHSISLNTYIPCAEADVMCGVRFCEVGEFNNVDRISGTTIITVTTGGQNCHGSVISANADVQNPGLVDDGTRCGDDSVCFLNQCVPLSSLNIPPCPVGSNGLSCSGNGQCNTDNQCSCSIGFTGSVCDVIVTIPGASGGAIAGGIIGTILIVGLIAGVVVLVVFLVLKFGNNRKYQPRTQSTPRPAYNKPTVNTHSPVTSVSVVRPNAPPPSRPGPSSQAQRRPPPPSRPAAPPPSRQPPSRPSQPHTDPTSRRDIHRPPPPNTRPPPPKPVGAARPVPTPRASTDGYSGSHKMPPVPSGKPQVARKPMVPPK